MRLVVLDCEVDYSGRLRAALPRATRLLMIKADGTVLLHADGGSKPLNWMTPPCRITEGDGSWVVLGCKEERLDIVVHEIKSDTTIELGAEPGLTKTHTERELHALLADHPDAIEPGLQLVAREHPTDVGPVDLLCRDSEGRSVAVEVKRIGDLDGVEQLCRYVERLGGPDYGFRGVFVAKVVTPQAKTLAQARGVRWVEVDFDALAGRVSPRLALF